MRLVAATPDGSTSLSDSFRINKARSALRVCLKRNSRNGPQARSKATSGPTWRLRYGVTASASIRCHTGAITWKERNRDNAIMIWFEGDCCVPKACRKKDNTTTIRVNDVKVTSTNGATDNRVKRIKISTTVASSVPLSDPVKSESADEFIRWTAGAVVALLPANLRST